MKFKTRKELYRRPQPPPAPGDSPTLSRTVAEEWAEYSVCIPKTAEPLQFLEMRRAFYAGITAMQHLMMMVGADDVSEDAGAAFFECVRQEAEEFHRKVGKVEGY